MPKAYFIGICGVGMAAVAQLLQQKGWEVSGSDEGFYPPISDYLTRHKIICHTPHKASNLPKDADLIVIGKHAKLVPESNEEVAAALASGIPVKSFPEVLDELTKATNNYVVAGSFGKSSCSWLLTWILTYAKKDPSYFVGALGLNIEENAHLGLGKNFILEGDEYPSANWDSSPKFLHYNAHHLLLTSCEHDHINVYPTLESYLDPFKQLVKTLPRAGILMACCDGEQVEDVVMDTPAKVIWYSLHNSKATWHAANLQHEGHLTHFLLMQSDQEIGEVTTQLLGEHNVQNIVGVAALLLETEAVDFADLAKAVREFKGVHRRLELRTTKSQIPLYEDFGSSRPKALAGIRALHEQFPDRRLIVLFEPHTFSFRNHDALSWYDDLFAQADVVYVANPPTHGATDHNQLSLEEITNRIALTGKEVHGFTNSTQLLEQLKPMLKPGDVLLVETSGALLDSLPPLLEYLES